MAGGKINITIGCQHIAPLDNLHRDFLTGSLKIAIFANNGSGKTFISRLFRLFDTPIENLKSDTNLNPTDSLIRFGYNSGRFIFKIKDKQGNIVENINLTIQKNISPTLVKPHYLYHVFNQDYVEENIQVLNYEKDPNIQGYILGKIHIDLSNDEIKLKKIEEDGCKLKAQISQSLQTYIKDNIDPIRDIKRLQEYKEFLDINTILDDVKKIDTKTKSLDELFSDYNKIKSMPENLADIQYIDNVCIDTEYISQICDDLNKSYTLSSFAETFKDKIRKKQDFIEQGLRLYNENKKYCPFCEQELTEKAISLIDNYTTFLTDVEAQCIRVFQDYTKRLNLYIHNLSDTETVISRRKVLYDEYKIKYIPTLKDNGFEDCSIVTRLKGYLEKLIELTDKKSRNINTPITVDETILSGINGAIIEFNKIIDSNNGKIKIINQKKNKIGDENKRIRKEICKSTYIHLTNLYNREISKLHELRNEYNKLNIDIQKRKEANKVSRKKKVYETIKRVLDYFFSGKYTLNEDDFNLIFNKTSLEKGQVKNVLSEGEKNIIAFAYYLGDTYLKIEKEENYQNLFFIIDDPISSMDFNYVYTLCGVIRDLKLILNKIDKERMIILTHNNDFMRILCANNIMEKKLLLRNDELIDFNENFTVPYISHLIDIYKIARKGEKAKHTTANSIRHIIETLIKFQNLEISNDSILDYINKNIPHDKKSYIFINDLSHGGWRSEQEPLTDDDYKEVCEAIITHIEKLFPNHIKYCEKFK